MEFMDSHFLEFWGNVLINVAKGQRQLDDISKWMMQGFKGFEDLTALFRKFYGLDHLKEDAPDYMNVWKKASEDFQKSFKDYFSLFDLVPRQKYLELVEEYEALKEKVATQEETIKHLRILLGEKMADQEEMVNGFQDLIKKQSEQFLNLITNMGQFFLKGSPKTEE
jgi:hypothetical protein